MEGRVGILQPCPGDGLVAADLLDITARMLASIIGVSEATVSRMRRQEFLLERGTKPFELAVL
ncbi:MAG: hypothetical protein E5Y58_29580, partial [Mesorhizobium sp.]